VPANFDEIRVRALAREAARTSSVK
jgi:hypothetical protein